MRLGLGFAASGPREARSGATRLGAGAGAAFAGRHDMDAFSRAMVWGQFGAAIDMLENVVRACPEEL